jgi:orotidine-5'-phosphate decarboxylase
MAPLAGGLSVWGPIRASRGVDVNFADRLLSAVEEKQSHVVVGLDPDYASMPPSLRAAHEAMDYPDEVERVCGCFREFLLGLLEGLADVAVAVKPQLAFFEALGHRGFRLYEDMVARAVSLGYLVIADAKRGDIGNTAEAYARAHLDVVGADAITVNPYFGTDGLEPFLRRAREEGKGLFVLVKTSNPSSSEIQDLSLEVGQTVYQRVGDLVSGWGAAAMGERLYSSVGAVVGATHPRQAADLRVALPATPLLIPGYGAQGARAADLAGVFDSSGSGAVVNSARAILYAYKNRGGPWLDAARAEAEEMRAALWQVARG